MASASEIVRTALLGDSLTAGARHIRFPWSYVAALKQYADAEPMATFDEIEKLFDMSQVEPVLLPPSAGHAALELLFFDSDPAHVRAVEVLLFAWLEQIAQARPDQYFAAISLWPPALPLTDHAFRCLAQQGNLNGSQIQALAGSRQADRSSLARGLRACGMSSAPRGCPLASDVALALARLGDELELAADFFDLWGAATANGPPRHAAAASAVWGLAAEVRKALGSTKPRAASPLAVAVEPTSPMAHRPTISLRDLSGVPRPTGFRWRCIPTTLATRLQDARAWRWPPPSRLRERLSWWVKVAKDAVTDRWHLAPGFVEWLQKVISEPALARVWSHFEPPIFSAPIYPIGSPDSPDQKDAAILFCLHQPPPEGHDCAPNLVRFLRAIHRAWSAPSCLGLRTITKLASCVRWSRAPKELVLLCMEASLTKLPGRLVGLRERLASLRAWEAGGPTYMYRKVDSHLRRAMALCR